MMTSSLDGTTNNRRRPKPRKADNTTVTTPSTPVVQALTPPRNVYNLKRSVFSKPKLTEMIKLSGTRTSDQFWLRFGTARIVGGTGSMMQLPGVRPYFPLQQQKSSLNSTRGTSLNTDLLCYRCICYRLHSALPLHI